MSQPRKEFKTKAGTALPILNLKGKEYLQVMHRIQWFREENPTGIIKTQMLEKNGTGKDAFSLFRAEIYLNGQLVATGHKMETQGGFPDYIEKAESGSIGRALAMCGYGTQFAADDLDEGDRLADSPAPRVESSTGVAVAATPAARPSFRKNVTAVGVVEQSSTGGDDI